VLLSRFNTLLGAFPRSYSHFLKVSRNDLQKQLEKINCGPPPLQTAHVFDSQWKLRGEWRRSYNFNCDLIAVLFINCS
jgi:hypothetical protein